ncbi:hypothetical protein PybrP1_002833 [[Pythium] brassicae (nom. inval.)]|nr:hypothetical protein PybrP1_002833 [[Pythium] brassicae (nom. inval.)]
MVAPPSSRASSVRKPLPPHYLGGSNNLVSERSRREKAESALQSARSSLRAVSEALEPRVEQLTQTIKRHQQIDVDAAAHQALDELQQQLDELGTQQAQFPAMLDAKIAGLAQQTSEQKRADTYVRYLPELKLLVAHVQDAQDDLNAESRLLRHELMASREFLSTRMNAVEDAVECIRQEVVRASEQQFVAQQMVAGRIAELDEKLFTLDKELLKVKLSMPSGTAAQLGPAFANERFTSPCGSSSSHVKVPSGGMAIQQKFQELALDIASLKADAIACRAADRKQFDGLTNRLREATKCNQTFKKDFDSRLQELQSCCDQMVTKMPSELSKRLLQAQSLWDEELQNLRVCVNELNEHRTVENLRDQQVRTLGRSEIGIGHGDELLAAVSSKLETIDGLKAEFGDLRDDVQLLRDGQDTTVRIGALTNEVEYVMSCQRLSSFCADFGVCVCAPRIPAFLQLKALSANVTRVEADVLGLYDWSREKIGQLQEEVTYTSAMLAYFSAHAKILPK